MAPADRTMDGHREICLLIRRSGLGRQVHIRRFAVAPVLAKLVQTTNPFLAVRWLGGSAGQVGRRRSLPGTMSGCPVVSVLESGHCIRLFSFLPLDNVELDFVTFFGLDREICG